MPKAGRGRAPVVVVGRERHQGVEPGTEAIGGHDFLQKRNPTLTEENPKIKGARSQARIPE
jgi:hypothetical protein